MDLATLAKAQAVNRVALGAGLIAVPLMAGRALGRSTRAVAGTMAAGSAGIAAAYAWCLRSGRTED
jgi:hypothetical protein